MSRSETPSFPVPGGLRLAEWAKERLRRGAARYGKAARGHPAWRRARGGGAPRPVRLGQRLLLVLLVLVLLVLFLVAH
eukprot:2568991-Pyramimonas_sp.AAC.1